MVVLGAPRAAELEVRECLGPAGVPAHPFIFIALIARGRDVFRVAGLNPYKYRGSVKALLRRVLKGSDVPALPAAVDLANAVSPRCMTPVGAHDVAGLVDALAVRPARAGATFRPIESATAEWG